MGAQAVTVPDDPVPGAADRVHPSSGPAPELQNEPVSAATDKTTGEPGDTSTAAPSDPAAALPPVETIGPETDLAPWLKPGIPQALKNAALRRKWLSTPAIRDYVDPALDYAWDWNAAAAVPGAAGRVGSEAAAKMLKSLIEPPQTHHWSETPVGLGTEPGSTPATAAPLAAEESPHAARSPAGQPVPTAPTPATPAASPAPSPAPRRRHGGAIPARPDGCENKHG